MKRDGVKCGLHTVLSSMYYQVTCVGVVEKGTLNST